MTVPAILRPQQPPASECHIEPNRPPCLVTITSVGLCHPPPPPLPNHTTCGDGIFFFDSKVFSTNFSVTTRAPIPCFCVESSQVAGVDRPLEFACDSLPRFYPF